MINAEDLYTLVDQLPYTEKQRLVEHVQEVMKREAPISNEEWHKRVRSFYGIFADDPIERPEQPPLEERDPIE